MNLTISSFKNLAYQISLLKQKFMFLLMNNKHSIIKLLAASTLFNKL